jgi:hypothetical protein
MLPRSLPIISRPDDAYCCCIREPIASQNTLFTASFSARHIWAQRRSFRFTQHSQSGSACYMCGASYRMPEKEICLSKLKIASIRLRFLGRSVPKARLAGKTPKDTRPVRHVSSTDTRVRAQPSPRAATRSRRGGSRKTNHETNSHLPPSSAPGIHPASGMVSDASPGSGPNIRRSLWHLSITDTVAFTCSALGEVGVCVCLTRPHRLNLPRQPKRVAPWSGLSTLSTACLVCHDTSAAHLCAYCSRTKQELSLHRVLSD